ncbi:unnamed protein product, partial [Meganyctiphanes norvegica]
MCDVNNCAENSMFPKAIIIWPPILLVLSTSAYVTSSKLRVEPEPPQESTVDIAGIASITAKEAYGVIAAAAKAASSAAAASAAAATAFEAAVAAVKKTEEHC